VLARACLAFATAIATGTAIPLARRGRRVLARADLAFATAVAAGARISLARRRRYVLARTGLAFTATVPAGAGASFCLGPGSDCRNYMLNRSPELRRCR